MKEYRCAAYSYTGRRTRNQDNFLLNGQTLDAKHGNDSSSSAGLLSGPILLAAVDGAGTKTTGETASRIVCEELWKVREKFEEVNELSETGSIINEALVEVNKSLESVLADEPTSKIGATVSLLLIYNGKVLFGNVGDSAVYMRRNGKVTKLTRDHTEGEELLARGALTEEMLKVHSSKTKVTRKLGSMTFGKSDIMQFYEVADIQDGDIFMLCTPGIVQYIGCEDINVALQSGIDMQKCAERIVKCAMDNESKDNATALVIKITEQVDNVGNKNIKAKPIKSKGVHVQTAFEINPETIKVLAYLAVIVAMLGFAIIYTYVNFPRDITLTHIEQNGNSWSKQSNGVNGTISSDGSIMSPVPKNSNDSSSSDDSGKSDNNPIDLGDSGSAKSHSTLVTPKPINDVNKSDGN